MAQIKANWHEQKSIDMKSVDTNNTHWYEHKSIGMGKQIILVTWEASWVTLELIVCRMNCILKDA